MKNIMQDKYILGQSIDKTINTVGQEIRLDLSLEPNTNNLTGGKIHGKVITSTGDPIENALVKIMSSNFDPLMHDLTDSNGDYSFTNISPNQTYNIFAVASGMNTNQGNQFTVSQYEDITIDFTMTEDAAMSLCVIAGDLIDQSSNNPIEGAVISLYKVNADNTQTLQAITYTNEYGQYVFREIPLGDYVVKISALGYNSTESNINLSQSGQLLPMNVSVIPDANTSRGTVSGIITDNNNQPINRADVILYKVETDTSLTPVAFTKTNIAGIYLFANVQPGEYKVKSNEIEIVSINVPDPWSYSPSFVDFQLMYTQNYYIETYVAQNGTLANGADISATTGFVTNLGGPTQGSVTLDITVPRSGAYSLAVQYLTTTGGVLKTSINGNAGGNAYLTPTNSLNVADAKTYYVHGSLNQGSNTIKFYNNFQELAPQINNIDVYILPYATTRNITSGILENGATDLGTGYVSGIGGAQNGSVTFTVEPQVDNEYVLGIYFVNPNSPKPMKVSVDGGPGALYTFPQTPNNQVTDAVEYTISLGFLTAGTHTVKFYNDTGADAPIPGYSQIRLIPVALMTLAKDGILENGAIVLPSDYVGSIGGANSGSVRFTTYIQQGGEYYIGLQYLSPDFDRSLKVSINSNPGVLYTLPQTASDQPSDSGIYYIKVNLIQGDNNIKIYNDITTFPESPYINTIYIQQILLNTTYEATNSNVLLYDGASVENGIIKNVAYNLGYIILKYNVPFYGPFFLRLKYVTMTNDKKSNISVNGVSTGETYTFDSTASTDIVDAKIKEIPLIFNHGINNVKIYNAI